jgi:membrane fusion protein, heavy metal efflux system
MRKRNICAVILMFVGLLPRHCIAHEGHQPLPSKGVLVDTERGYVTLSSQAREAIGLQADEVVVGEVSSNLFAYAETVAPWQSKAFGSAQISGRITKLLVRPGDTVVKGQVVAEMSSRELESLRLEYAQAKNEFALNKELLELTKPSAQSGAVPMQRLLDLENAYQQSENALEIARIRARTLGVDAKELDRVELQEIRHLIRAPIAGKIVHSDLSEGKFVDSFENLFEIVNNDFVWVRMQLLEKDVFKVAIGQKVELTFADSHVSLTGEIDRIDVALEPKSQISWAWMTVSHPAIIPGLVGSAKIQTSHKSDRLSIPLSSIYSDGLQSYVFVEESSTKSSSEYRKRNVKIGQRTLMSPQSSQNSFELLQGDVYPGDRVVVKGGHELSSLFFLGILKLKEADRVRLGIRTATATHRPIANALNLAAIVALPPESRSIASSQLPGTIRSHTLTPGKPIRAGELLMEITSPEFYLIQLDLLKTSLDASLSRYRARRLEELRSDAFSRRVLLETISKADQLEQRVDSLKRQLQSLGLSITEINSIVQDKKILDYLPIRSAIDGYLVRWTGTLGETILANQSLVEIQNIQSVWIEALVPIQDMLSVTLTSAGQASLLSNPEIQFPVAVSRIGPIVDEATRTQRIWLITPSFPQNLNLRNGMQLSISLKVREGESAVVIPMTAVLRDGLHSFAFVQKADGYVERRRVTTNRSDGEWIEVTEGIVAGEEVIVAGGRELQTAFASLR